MFVPETACPTETPVAGIVMVVLFRVVTAVAAVVWAATGVKIRLVAPAVDGAVSSVNVVPETLSTLAATTPVEKVVQVEATDMPG